jgi:hypothetical protein
MRGRHAPPRDRRRSLQPLMLTAGVLTALATTGGVISAVGWSSGSTSETFTVHAAEIPRIARPAIRAHAQPRIAWKPVRLAEDVPVQRYVVTRHLGTVAQVACDIPATARPRCIDRFAPPGYQATYTVTARHGAHWRGTDSEPSPAVTMPGVAVPISVNGQLIVPGAAGTPVVVGSAPVAAADPSASAPAAAPDPAGEPSTGADPPIDVIAEPPAVVVPPAPPERTKTEEPVTSKPDTPEKPAERPSDKPSTEAATAPAADPPTHEVASVTAD